MTNLTALNPPDYASPVVLASIWERIALSRRQAQESDWPCAALIFAAPALDKSFRHDSDLLAILVDLPPAAYPLAEQWVRCTPRADHYEGAWGEPVVCLRFTTAGGQSLLIDIDSLEYTLVNSASKTVRILLCVAAGSQMSLVQFDAATLFDGSLSAELHEAYTHANEQRANIAYRSRRGWLELEYFTPSEPWRQPGSDCTTFIAKPRASAS